ncbi:hypothetical protein [Arundinibacter roseus]|uniref:DUF2892 domain-containing protein n=1 Tax=Arundinibacter roseus TaxID=2070510 RepID=A0A4R4KH22_9BACT|nr:hypothetical protein [Arundinibacter roseus]TDB67357.1 hypothetical protein EZE20_05260 [Arundinibacter roseus]
MTTLLKNWDFIRVLRLAMALWIGYSAIIDQQPWLGVMAAFLGYQAIFNVGCCGTAGCSVPGRSIKDNTAETKEIDYEEVKPL